MTVFDDHAASVRQRAELRKFDWMIPVKATPEHKARVLAHLEAAARFISPEHMPNDDAGRKNWKCEDCGNSWGTDYSSFVPICGHCDSYNVIEVQT